MDNRTRKNRMNKKIAEINNNLSLLDIPSGAFSSLIEDLARCEVEAQEMTEFLNANGMTMTHTNGLAGMRPEYKIREGLYRRIDSIRKELGLTAKALAQITASSKSIASPDLDRLRQKLTAEDAPELGLSEDQIDSLLKDLF